MKQPQVVKRLEKLLTPKEGVGSNLFVLYICNIALSFFNKKREEAIKAIQTEHGKEINKIIGRVTFTGDAQEETIFRGNEFMLNFNCRKGNRTLNKDALKLYLVNELKLKPEKVDEAFEKATTTSEPRKQFEVVYLGD